LSKRKKIIIIAVSVTLALVMGVGGLIFAKNGDHEETGAHKLIGVGEMGYEDFEFSPPILGPTEDYYYEGEIRGWDTQFIITNPNCEKYLTIEWVALIESDEDLIAQGMPKDWNNFFEGDVIPLELSPHEVWQVSLAKLLYMLEHHGNVPSDNELYLFIADEDLDKYTLEVTWSGVSWSWWSGWGKLRPLTGWQKEKCRHMMWGTAEPLGPTMPVEFPGLTISEAEMQLFPSRMGFKGGEPYFYDRV